MQIQLIFGNLNSGDKPHYALTCKISEKPHLTEPSIKVKDYISNKKDFRISIKLNMKTYLTRLIR